LNVGDTLYAISEAGLTLTASKTEDTLKVYPAEKLTLELTAAIKEHKADIIRITREDEEMRRTGIIQSPVVADLRWRRGRLPRGGDVSPRARH
jgi:hypothetical protein